MKQFQTPKQSGFTLIELIVVMVILGILAATALPRFVNMGGDARSAALSGARGAMNSTLAMVHGRWLAGGSNTATDSIDAEGVAVAVDDAGYPEAKQNFITAAGIDSQDFTTFVGPSAANAANQPTLVLGEIAVIPKSVEGSTKGTSCYIKYTAYKPAANGNAAVLPVVGAAPGGDAC